MPAPRAVVLHSGGLDSTTVLALAISQGYSTYALSFHYGQKHAIELASAAKLASALNVDDHTVVRIDPRLCANSSLTGKGRVPHRDHITDQAADAGSTYVPARNTIFLAHALAWAETVGAADIFIGVTSSDTADFPDCRPEYIDSFESLANLAVMPSPGRDRIRIHAPLINMNKAEIIGCGLQMGIDYAQTHTCFDPNQGSACLTCDACLTRRYGFAQLGMTDPGLL